ncbi:T3SS effector HopA1 family protein [Streptomyces sp. NPDC091040]|uniref:T3SS effector HopA1 family protein n=1 Tax=Streptomyces sp. NPDC091040 TaxID=3365972 RepID=UPI00381165F6
MDRPATGTMTGPQGAPPAAPGTGLPDALTALLDTVAFDHTAGTVTVGGRVHTFDQPQHARAVLRNALYEDWHAGMVPAPESARPQGAPRGGGALERALIDAVPHRRTRATATVTGPAPSGSATDPAAEAVVVEHQGVRLCVPRSAVTGPDLAPGASVLVDVPAVRPWLSPGFLLVHGSAGGARRGGAGLVRVYVHLRAPEEAVPVWGTVLGALEGLGIPYQAKVLSHRRHYPRRDALVVYLGDAHADAAATVAGAVDRCRGGGPAIGEETSVFAARLAPGVALAREPADPRPGWRGLSFGQHRAGAVADGLIAHSHAPETGSRAAAVRAAMVRAGISPSAPERNLRPGGGA